MRRTNSRAVTIAALAATLLLGACTDMYLDRRESVSFAVGDANASNKAIQVIDPWPVHATNRNIAYDGERAAAAAERYRLNKVTPPKGIGTSSVRYESAAPQSPSAPSSN
jgi:hypothetical protein